MGHFYIGVLNVVVPNYLTLSQCGPDEAYNSATRLEPFFSFFFLFLFLPFFLFLFFPLPFLLVDLRQRERQISEICDCDCDCDCAEIFDMLDTDNLEYITHIGTVYMLTCNKPFTCLYIYILYTVYSEPEGFSLE